MAAMYQTLKQRIVLFNLLLIIYQLTHVGAATTSYRSGALQFNQYQNGLERECTVHASFFIAFDCKYEFQVYKRDQLIRYSRNSNDFSSRKVAHNKNRNPDGGLTKIVKTIKDGKEEGVLMVLFETKEQFVPRREISLFWPVANSISLLVQMKFDFTKKVKDFYMVDHTGSNTDQRYVFVFDDNTLSLMWNTKYQDTSTRTDLDLIKSITLGTNVKFIKGYQVPAKDGEDNDVDYFVVISEKQSIYFLQKFQIIKADKKLSMKAVSALKSIGNSKVESFDIDNKYIVVGMPSINRVNVYKSSDFSQTTFVSSPQNDQQLGQSLVIKRKILKPKNIEAHYVYYSRRQLRDEKHSWEIGLLSIFHDSQDSVSHTLLTNDVQAFILPQKEESDIDSNWISFDITEDKFLSKSQNDQYFEYAGLCQSDQKWTKADDDSYQPFCSQCPYNTQQVQSDSSYFISKGLQDEQCLNCKTMNADKSLKTEAYFYEQICKSTFKPDTNNNDNKNNNNGGSSNNNGGSSTDNGGSSNNNNNNGGSSNNNNGGSSNNNNGGGFQIENTNAPKVVTSSEGEDDGLTIALSSVLGGLAVIAIGVGVAYYTIKKRKDSGDKNDVNTTPKKKGEGFSPLKNLMNSLTKKGDEENLKNHTKSFTDTDVKVKQTKEQIIQAEKEKIEQLKIQLRANGMDEDDIQKQIGLMNPEKKDDDSDFSDPGKINDDEGLNNHRRKNGSYLNNLGINIDDIKLDPNGPLEIDENQMKQSMKSEHHKSLQGFAGIPNGNSVKQSFEGPFNSRTDDAILTKSKFTKNPKLEQQKDTDIHNIQSVEFNSNDDESKSSQSDSINNQQNKQFKQNQAQTASQVLGQGNVRNSVVAPNIVKRANNKVLVGNSESSDNIEEMSDEDFSDDDVGVTNAGNTAKDS